MTTNVQEEANFVLPLWQGSPNAHATSSDVVRGLLGPARNWAARQRRAANEAIFIPLPAAHRTP